MKKYIIILASAVCALFACQKNEIELLNEPIVKQIDDSQYSYTFTAVIADSVTDSETKASIGRNGTFTWAVNDALTFYDEDKETSSAVITAIDGLKATIEVSTSKARAKFLYAVYPATAHAGEYKINLNTRGPIVVSAVNGGTLKFHHIGSLIKIKFTDIPSGTASMVFKPKTAFSYDGTFSFTDRVPSLTSTGTTSEIVVSASTDDDGKDITICVPSITLSGFSAALNNKADGTGRNLFLKSTATEHNLGTSAPMLLNMKSVAYEAPTQLLFATSSTAGHWDVSDVVPIQTGANEYTLNLNTSPTAKYYFYDEYNKDNKENGSLAKGTNTNVENNFGTWKIIGDAVASDWSYSNGAQLRYFGQEYWSVLKNRSITATKYFKAAYGSDGVVFAAPSDADDVIPTIGAEYSTWKKTGNGGKAFKLSTTGSYDIYFRYNNDSDTKVIVASAAANFGDGAAIYTYTFNSSSNTATSTPQWGILDKPFYDSSIEADLRFVGFSAGWSSSNTEIKASSKTNDSYWVFDVSVSSTGTLEYKFKKTGDSYSDKYNWGLKDAQATNAGSNLYGSTVAQNSTGNNTCSALVVGTYKLYVNAYSWYGNRKMNYMFVKQ